MPLIILSTLKTDENNTLKIPFNTICANSIKGDFRLQICNCKYAKVQKKALKITIFLKNRTMLKTFIRGIIILLNK